MKKKTIRTIKIDADKCIGCLSCEVVCSASHASIEFSYTNPKKSRIRVFKDELNNMFVPIFAGPYTAAECNGRNVIKIDGKEYSECTFCRASCPSRDLFKEPDTNIPLKCDMCGEPPLSEPMCVKWCLSKALTYVEREEEQISYSERKGPNFVVTAYDVEAEDIRQTLKNTGIEVRSVKAI